MGIDRELYLFYGIELSGSVVDDYITRNHPSLNDDDKYLNLSEYVSGFLVLHTMSGTKYFLVAFKPEPCEEDRVYKLDPLTSDQAETIKNLMNDFNVQGIIRPICIVTNY